MSTQTMHEGFTKVAEKTQFSIEGLALLEAMETMSKELKPMAYVFDPVGKLLGSAPLEENGRFHVPVHLHRPADVQLFIGPAGEPEAIRASSVYKESFHAKDWISEGGRHLLKPRVFLPKDLWAWWRPVPISVTGHVRTTTGRPIPYLKVEVFDVDREGFFWPYLMNRALAPNLKVIHLADLLEKGPAPAPGPELAERFGAAAMPYEGPAAMTALPAMETAASVEPQPEPSIPELFATRAGSRVGEMATAPAALAEKLEKVTVTSTLPLWDLFPFYSKKLVATAATDGTGFFSSYFLWSRFHVRHGRLRYDALPDLVLRVTQTIDGVEKVLYLDPYTSTRWNVTSTHVDLWLDDAEIVGGSPSTEAPPAMQAFFTRVGNDEVFHVDQATGLYHGAPYANVSYGATLHLHGQLGKSLTAGAPKRFYRMSYRKGAAGSFTAMTLPLTDVRVSTTTLHGETYFLGPQSVHGTTALYEARDLDHYYWYNPDFLALWNTAAAEAKTGLFTLRLEVFDENGQPLSNVDYRNGTAQPTVPAGELPKMTHCDLVLAVNNQAPAVNLEVSGVPMNGVVAWTPTLALDFNANIAEPNGLLYGWGLRYTLGLDPASYSLPVGGTFNAGTAAPSGTLSIPVSSLGIDSSYALAFKLWATAHVRNGYDFIYYNEQIKAVAIQRCPEDELASFENA